MLLTNSFSRKIAEKSAVETEASPILFQIRSDATTESAQSLINMLVAPSTDAQMGEGLFSALNFRCMVQTYWILFSWFWICESMVYSTEEIFKSATLFSRLYLKIWSNLLNSVVCSKISSIVDLTIKKWLDVWVKFFSVYILSNASFIFGNTIETFSYSKRSNEKHF